MANLDLSKYGIQDVKEIIHNPSYDVLFAEETKPGLEGFEKGQVTELGAVNVMTGIYTGRSPKDKFFVMNEASKDSVWWTSEEYKNDNKPCSEEAWADLKAKAVKELSGKRLFVAKVINLDKESEPDIYAAIKRDALLENVTVAADGKIDFADKSVTENTRVSYPIYHINNIVKPVSKGPHAHQVIFLSADAFGVLPPVSILNPEQAQYYFLSGFTAKLAGTERGITEPTPTFSACFGAAFLSLHPTKYAEELVKKMNKVGAKAYLVNTGWNGSGKRISIKDTRGIIDAILDGSIDKAPTKVIPFFDFVVPTELPNVDPKILDPRDTYECACQWEEKAKDLAGRFIKNFAKFTGNEAGKALVAAGPKL